MHKQLVVLFALAFLAITQAWSFDVWTSANYRGKRRSFYDLRAGNNCFSLPSDVSAKVHSFKFCSMAWTRCSITIHSNPGCTGSILGSATAAAPRAEWHKKTVSSAGSKMKSFRISGCKSIPIAGNLDVQKCS
ncbi:hypothetical protein DFQ27_002697 [Actinomortierella ambigua]|uniref:Secreted protein n=1 Tax=Actinomortierella ambigua TaxID=1343610 RepID=A0A9P6QBB5_9FUNG|nr:hypothetical protein DFQ26_001999 [Actinomortierella ambigua]KAG0261925.1 hypothetical protein DFQ27_002697 [Actinomortierella ambigua]